MKFGTMTFINTPKDCDEKFARLREYGFEACQIIYKPETYTDEAAIEVKEKAEYYGIDISAQFAGFRDAEIAWYDTRYLASTLKGRVALFAQGIGHVSPRVSRYDEEAWAI